MKGFSKWLAIIWSVLCLIGIFVGMANVSEIKSANEYEEAGAAIGAGCGLGIWLVVWIVVVGPSVIIYLVSGKNETAKIEINSTQSTELCRECGKYYSGNPKFCPNCGKTTIFK